MFIFRYSHNLISYLVIFYLVFRLTNIIFQYDVACPDLIELQRQTSPSTRSLTEEKRPSIIDAIR